MVNERELLMSMGMPESVAARTEIFSPRSVGVIVHTGHFNFEERRRSGGQEPAILLVRQADQLVDDFHPWGIPAGSAEAGEGIIQTAVREVGEETGLNVQTDRLKWFCPGPGDRQAILSYPVKEEEIPGFAGAQEHELGIKVFEPGRIMDIHEVDRLALVPVEVFADHMLTGTRHHFRRLDLKPNYLYYPRSEEVNENIDFVPVMYKPKIWQAIRHQMFVRKIIPPYLG